MHSVHTDVFNVQLIMLSLQCARCPEQCWIHSAKLQSKTVVSFESPPMYLNTHNYTTLLYLKFLNIVLLEREG